MDNKRWYSLEYIATYTRLLEAIKNTRAGNGNVIVEIYEDNNKNEIGDKIDSFAIDFITNDSIDCFNWLLEFYYNNDGYYSICIYRK